MREQAYKGTESGSLQQQPRLICMSYWMSTFAEGASRILIPLYFYSIGVQPTKIALMFLFYEAFGLATNMFAGFFINRSGYKRAFVIALVLHTIASVGYLALSSTWPMWTLLLWVNCLRAMRGIGKELMKTASAAYFKSMSATHMQAQTLLGGKDSAKGLGLLAGGICLSWFGFFGSFLALGVATTLCFIGSMYWLRDFREVKSVSYKGFWKVSPQLFQLSMVRAFLYAGRDLWLVLAIPIYLSSINISKVSIGAILAVGLITFGLFQPMAGWFVKSRLTFRGTTLKRPWLYEDVVPFATFLLMFVPLLMIWAKASVWAITTCIIVYNLLSGLATAPHNDLHLRFAQKERASVDIAYYKTIAQVGKVLAVFLSGVLYDLAGIQGCLWGASVSLCLSCGIGTWMTLQSRQGSQAQKFIAKYVHGEAVASASLRS